MIKGLPPELIRAAQKILDEQNIIDSEDLLKLEEDEITAQAIPGINKPQKELSGEKEEVIINPEYKTFSIRRPY